MELYKSIGQSFADVDVPSGRVSGWFSSFGVKDSDGDIIRQGAYAKTISENGPNSSAPRIKHLIDHDRTKLFTRLTELGEEPFGLKYVGIAGRHKEAQDFLMKVEDKLITEHSVYIVPIKQSMDATLGANIITECKMWEGSSLHCWGANQFTPILSVNKSLEDLQVVYLRLKKALTTGTYSDETMIEFQKQYDEIGQLLKATQPARTTEPEVSQEPNINLFEIFKNAALNGN